MTNFDWVTARHRCSASTVFARLRESIKVDAKLRSEQTKGTAIFSVSNEEFTIFVTRRLVDGNEQTISLVRTATSIGAFGVDGKELCVATLSLNKTGDCCLKVGSDELSEWEFRKLALENLFFGA